MESFTAGYLRVWVEYHLMLGFSHLFVYDRWGIDAGVDHRHRLVRHPALRILVIRAEDGDDDA